MLPSPAPRQSPLRARRQRPYPSPVTVRRREQQELEARLAAERLGLPFSSYRRHLTAGTARLTAWLWDRELYGTEQRVSTDLPVG